MRLTTIVSPVLALCALLAARPALAAPPTLHVEGTRLKDGAGRVVRLQGVNVPSLDWSNTGDHLAPSVDAALTGWKARIIRLPLSQDRWFGKAEGSPAGDGGAQYRAVVDRVVRQIAARNAYVLLDLHWSDGGQWGQHIGQHAMPDQNSVAFWKEVAARYANQSAVLFDLYNEPHDVSWDVWQKGGLVDERNSDPRRGLHLQYRTPGMQALLDTVRATGAKNVVVAGGLDWGYDLRGIVQGHALQDSRGNGILYGTHIYPWKKDWDVHVTPAAQKFAVFVGEVGTKPWKAGDPPHENVYTPTWASEVIAYLNRHQLSWTAWSFHPSANPCLITGWDYRPTDYWGVHVKAALAGGFPYVADAGFAATLRRDPLVARAISAMLGFQRESWEQGVVGQALIEAGERGAALALARASLVHANGSGVVAAMGGSTTDPLMLGDCLWWAARQTEDPALVRAADDMLRFARTGAPRADDGTPFHQAKERELWSDGSFTSPPFLAAAGRYDDALAHLRGVLRRLWDDDKHLMRHRWSEPKQAFVNPKFWGGGNGWTAAALTRVLRALPADRAADRASLATQLRALLDGCLAHQRPDGLFHDEVDNPASFVETNLAAMLAYSIYESVRGGWLPASYLPRADRMRAGVRARVDRFGFVQGVAGAPHFDKPGISAEGQAFFVLMEAAARKAGRA